MGVGGWVARHAVELDGRLVEQGRRLADLDAGELLSWGYYVMVSGMDAEHRAKLDYALRPDAAVVINDPELPASMQGLRPPAWWKGDVPVEGLITMADPE